MGALVPSTPWIPEDDLLLKNAVEAGASLESLAKGAVRFSRRFTIRELQDRWHSLLYDPIISAQASARMIEFERSASNLSSKSIRADNFKDNKCGHGKRKGESVRKLYYAMRKRICNEPLNQGDLNFLVGSDNCFITGVEVAPGLSNMLNANNFNDLHHVFPQVMGNRAPSCGVGEFPNGQQEMLEDHIEKNVMHEEVPHMRGDNMVIDGNSTRIDQIDPPKEMPDHNIFETNPVCSNKDIICSGFGGNTIFNSPISGCLQYTSPPPAMPDWKTIEGISVSGMPGDVNIGGDNMQTGDPFTISDDCDTGKRTSEYDAIHGEPQLKNSADCTDGSFAEFSDPLFNFTGDYDMLDIGEKDVMDLDGLSELLLNSPDDVNEDKMPNMPENNTMGDFHLVDGNPQHSSETQMETSEATVNPQLPELRDGVICCTLNTEDPEIPCNDNILFSSKPRPTPVHKRNQSEAGKDNTGNQASEKGLSIMKAEPKRVREPDIGLNHAVDEVGVKSETSKGELINSSRNPSESRLAIRKEEVQLVRPTSVAEKPGVVSDVGRLKTVAGGVNQGGQTPLTTINQELCTLGSTDHVASEHGGELSDSEEDFADNDTDIPYYSDIESMILDMDLSPDDDTFFSREVAKYQHEDAKRAIIRLEQAADSYMQRAMASRGAFAVLYGRHSKHYIKKPEVLLGRATDDVVVDIDLAREGRANTISRRQAIIKMDKDGTFSLKNVGKYSICVNSREISTGQCLSLHSKCLIEIKGMPFIFETNQACVKQYLDKAAQKSEANRLNVC